MRKILSVFFVCVGCSLVAENFSESQCCLKKASEIQAETAKMQIQATREIDNINALITSTTRHVKNLEEKIAKAKKTNANFASTNAELSAEVRNNVQSIKKLSDFLDDFYSQMFAEVPAFAKHYLKTSIIDFKTKTVPEKLRIVLNVLDALASAEKSVDIKKSEVATGLFLRLRGEFKGDVSTLKVEEQK